MNSKRRLLMSEPDVGPSTGQVKVSIDTEPGLFFELTDQPGVYATFFVPSKGLTVFDLGDRVPISCMFDVNWLTRGGQRVGLVFRSTFQVKNGGGYLVAFMNQARGKAQSVDVLLKTDDLVIYNYPNKGTLVVLTQIGPEVTTIFEEQ